jgi:hypothetical protein
MVLKTAHHCCRHVYDDDNAASEAMHGNGAAISPRLCSLDLHSRLRPQQNRLEGCMHPALRWHDYWPPISTFILECHARPQPKQREELDPHVFPTR